MPNSKVVEWDPPVRELYRRAKEEAIAIGDNYLGTQHLMLAAVACSPIEAFGSLTLNDVRAVVRSTRVPNGDVLTPFSQTPRFKLAAQRAIERAFAESRPVNCADVWYGLLADPESECRPVLQFLGIEPRQFE